MPSYGTLTGVTVEEFGAQVRRRREVRRLSRRDLAQRSGVSYGTVDKLESPDPPRPKRTTAIDLATALDWDVAEALAMLGHEPLNEDERAGLVAVNSPREQLDRLLDDLTATQVTALLGLVRAIVHPQALPAQDVSGEVVIQPVTPGSGDTPEHIAQPQRRGPRRLT